LVQSRGIDRTRTGRSEACRYNLIDSIVALNGAFLINAAILIMSAANFFSRGIVVHEIQQAHGLLNQLLGSGLAPAAFGVALEHGPGDAGALAMAVTLAKTQHARLTLMHVVESPGGLVYGDFSESLHARQDRAFVEGIARAIEGPDLPVDVVVRGGATVETLVALTRELGLDMLVMGSHGHNGWKDLVFGETIHGVRHALTIPVVVVRTPAPTNQPAPHPP
jgi:nucleotide-binding universal stress UspA family protein